MQVPSAVRFAGGGGAVIVDGHRLLRVCPAGRNEVRDQHAR